jgi:hypothetical protein
MTEFKADPSKGVFDSSETKNLSEAFEKADEIINRPETPLDSEIDRDDLARHIKLSRTCFRDPPSPRC